MNTKKISEKVREIEELTNKLHTLQSEELLIRVGNHKVFAQHVSINVNNRSIPITVLGNSPFYSSCIRGKEMIHLGILKWYAALISDKEASLNLAKEELKKLINENL